MNTNPLYIFENGASLGIDLVPIASLIMISEYGSNADPLLLTKIDNSGMTALSTIDDFMANPSLYETFVSESELEKIDSIKSQPAWRILGRDSTHHAAGDGSVDFSYGTGSPLLPVTGAKGDYSFAEGLNTVAEGLYTHAEGCETFAEGKYSHTEGYKTHATTDGSHASGIETRSGTAEASSVFGRWNESSVAASENIFEIGNGNSTLSGNIFEIDTCVGTPPGAEIRTPQTTLDSILRPKALTTKEYVDSEFNNIQLGDLVNVTSVPENADTRVYEGNHDYMYGDVIKDPGGVVYRCVISYTSFSDLSTAAPDLGGTQFYFDSELGNWVNEDNIVGENYLMVYNPLVTSGINMGTGRWENVEDLDMGYY